ncbi:MAG: serine/threonine-protein kinase [Polyangia bacterium]
MARVYHGHDLVAGTPCVLKFALDPQDKVACLFLRREARITAQINHDHVVRLYHYGELPFLGPYLVTEYVAGPSLATLLDRGPLPMTPAILIGAQIASALHAVHRQGFEHRDVKPTNILLDEGGALAPHARLIDFGISGSGGEGDTRSAGSRYGTPEYVAPERITGEETGALADQYSLGCVLYEILTGRTPYAGESPQSVLQQHLLGTPRPLRTFPAAQEIPLALEYVVLRAMAREPRERFESMAALRAALAACLGGAARRGHPADRR